MPVYNPVIATSNVTILKNDVAVGTRPALNLIEGPSVAITVADDAGNSELDVTISSSAGGSALAGAYTVGTLSTFGEGCIWAESIYFSGSAFNGSAVWPSANRALYIPVQVLTAITVYKMGWMNGATVGTNSVDVGIYSEAGTRLVSGGGVLTAGASDIQVVDVADTALSPGTYFLAMSVNGVVDTIQRSNAPSVQAQAAAVQQQATAYPLPSTATFANPSSSYTPYLFAVFASATF